MKIVNNNALCQLNTINTKMVRVNQLGVNEIVCNLSQNINVLRFSDQWQVNYVSIKRCQYWANHHNFKLHSWDKHTYTLCVGIVVQQVVSWGNFEIYRKWKRLGSSKTHGLQSVKVCGIYGVKGVSGLLSIHSFFSSRLLDR